MARERHQSSPDVSLCFLLFLVEKCKKKKDIEELVMFMTGNVKVKDLNLAGKSFLVENTGS